MLVLIIEFFYYAHSNIISITTPEFQINKRKKLPEFFYYEHFTMLRYISSRGPKLLTYLSPPLLSAGTVAPLVRPWLDYDNCREKRNTPNE